MDKEIQQLLDTAPTTKELQLLHLSYFLLRYKYKLDEMFYDIALDTAIDIRSKFVLFIKFYLLSSKKLYKQAESERSKRSHKNKSDEEQKLFELNLILDQFNYRSFEIFMECEEYINSGHGLVIEEKNYHLGSSTSALAYSNINPETYKGEICECIYQQMEANPSVMLSREDLKDLTGIKTGSLTPKVAELIKEGLVAVYGRKIDPKSKQEVEVLRLINHDLYKSEMHSLH